MNRIYSISMLNYVIKDRYPDDYRWDVYRMDDKHHEKFGDMIREIYLEIPKFRLPLYNIVRKVFIRLQEHGYTGTDAEGIAESGLHEVEEHI